MRFHFTIDEEQDKREDLVDYLSRAIASAIELAVENDLLPVFDTSDPIWNNDWKTAHENGTTLSLVTEALGHYDSKDIAEVAEKSVITTLEALFKKDGSGLNIRVGKEAFSSLTDLRWR